METNKKDIIAVMKLFTKFMDTLKDDEFEQLLTGKAKIKISQTKSRRKGSKIEETKIEEFMDQIGHFNDREQTRKCLESLKMNKPTLVDLAKKLDVHIVKRDTKVKIMEKTIESVIGVKLRYQAIRDADVCGKNELGSKR